MKAYLVVVAGFIGVSFVKYMLNKYEEIIQIIVLDKFTKETEFLKEYIGEKKLVENIFTGYDIDYLVNFTAESHIDRNILGSGLFLEINIFEPQDLLDENGYSVYKERKKHIQVSTNEIFRALSRDCIEDKKLSVKRVVEGKALLVKIARELKWYIETLLNRGIEKTVRWYLDNQRVVLLV